MGKHTWEYKEEIKWGGTGIIATYKEISMPEETGKQPNELGICSWIRYKRGTMPDLRIITAYTPHKRAYPRANGVLYQQQITFMRSMGKTRCPFRVYEEDLLTQFPE